MSKNDPMNYNFNLLKERILDTLKLTKTKNKLKKINGPTLCVGSGGSKVVATFASSILNIKNKCSTKIMDPRDVLYENLKAYKNLFVCSYSGNNHGVNILSPLKIKKHLLTYKEEKKENFNNIKCLSSLPKEMSFISLAATLMPMSILLSYYLNDDIKHLINEMFDKISSLEFNIKNITLPFDIIEGNDTLTPSIYLDSTFTEAGIESITRHSKYDFCHGRSTLAYKQKRNLIYLISTPKELDELLLNNLKTRYDSIIILKGEYDNPITNNFYLTLTAIYLTKHIAESKNIDLSIVDYDKELCKKLYKYEGKM